jgi:alcohol dehydrogenase (cytochrome c)
MKKSILSPGLAIVLTAFGLAGVTEENLRRAQADPDTWLSYGRNYAGWRYSELSEINLDTVARLAPAWVFQTGVKGQFEPTPIVFGGMLYATGPSNHAWALDLLTGHQVWHYSKTPPSDLSLCCSQPNRGVAALGATVFKLNIEATLLALDARSGAIRWQTEVADYQKGYTETAAPLVVGDKVLIGSAGAEFGIRGFVDAYDAATGKRIWRFWTVPVAGEPAAKTWGGESWKTGGGSTWVTGTYDPELKLTYWGTSNPGPSMNGDMRPGDNLYTCSIVAIDTGTGKLKWYFQATPHDTHDWDAVSDPVLIDLVVNGAPVRALVQANRNGFLYALDRTNGKLIYAHPYTKQTWAKSIGPDERPVVIPGMEPSDKGTKTCPGLGGGHSWQSSTYSPQSGLFYFSSIEGCNIYYKTGQDYHPGQWFQASTNEVIAGESKASIIAVDPSNGRIRWQWPAVSQLSGGLLSTAGGLLFTGDPQGYLIAFDARTGKPVWRFQTGGPIAAPPVTYRFNGKQYIAVSTGADIMTFALVSGK